MVVPHAPGRVAPLADLTVDRLRSHRGELMVRRHDGFARNPYRADWRGWIALTWVLVWGWAYAAMAIQARAPQVVSWIRSVTTGH